MKKSLLMIIVLMLASLTLNAEVYDLEKAITTALENNESVRSAAQELEKSEYVYNEAFSGALPKVEANLTYLRNLYSSKITNMEYYFAGFSNALAEIAGQPASPMPPPEVEAMKNNTIQADISLMQPIWLGGKVGVALEVAVIFKKMNKSAFELEKNKVVTEIKKNFYQILVLKESKIVMDMVKKDAYENLDKVEKMYNEGLVSEYDFIQAKVRVNSIEPKIVSIDNYYELAKEYLKINMGIDGDEDFDISGELTEKIEPDTSAAYQKAVENRIELQLLQYQKELLQKNIDFEYSNHYPNIIGLANYSFQSQSDDLGDTFEKDHGVGALNLGVTANFPIFNGFGTKAKVDQAKVEEKKAALNIEKTTKFIRLQVKDAVSKLSLAMEELKLRDNEIAEYEKALEITQVRYDNGLCTQLELTGAQTALETSRLNKVNTMHNMITALIDLEAATGIVSLNEF